MTLTSASSSSSSGPRHRFLLVAESEPGNLFYTTTLLQRLQYNVWTARTADEAVEIATTAVPSLMITAQFLEDQPAHKLIHDLKLIERTQSIPIIVLGRKTDRADEQACLAAGAVTCLRVPVDVEALYRVIQVAVEQVPRMNIRINTRLSVSIIDRTVQCRDGECASMLSELGIYVRTHEPSPLKTRLPVRIDLEGIAISVDTEVIYSNRNVEGRQEPGMGLQFVHIQTQDQERIRKFIRHEITKIGD